ncbi:ABC transporter permease subunit [Pelomonas sp. CA6]|uniref:ABC transporter permease n=1 Tax=Pelomonas sp. CA6 TaxID=2907999 RepID=UPI001F4B3FC4|nr:ABC transporter permease subunit [Pelomonas sp. CA6]MCH7342809.1 ABC transporter permease subunit [Pelomonas sp. CA6]
MNRFAAFKTVFVKEVLDALRDHRTLARMLVPALLLGPLLLMAMSAMVSSLEERAALRQVYVVGIENGPTLRNYLERQTYQVVQVSGDYEAGLRSGKLPNPVLIVPKDFEAGLARGEAPLLEVVSDSSNQRAEAGLRPLKGLLQGFVQERASLALALGGMSGDLLRPVDVEERDLASVQSRATRITSIVPMFIVMAVLYGALTAALDSTAGERERGSLEPLLMNPAPHWALVSGKWAAVALLGMVVALMSNLSFLPAQMLLRSDSLQAMFQFGWGEVLRFLVLQLPLAAGLSALLMAMAIRTKSFKEAQASTALVVTLVGLAPMVTLMNPGGEAAWYYWVPGLAQNTLMMQVLKGEALRLTQVLPTVLVGAAMTVLCLGFVAREMRNAVAR